jgi:hypothetical protein
VNPLLFTSGPCSKCLHQLETFSFQPGIKDLDPRLNMIPKIDSDDEVQHTVRKLSAYKSYCSKYSLPLSRVQGDFLQVIFVVIYDFFCGNQFNPLLQDSADPVSFITSTTARLCHTPSPL